MKARYQPAGTKGNRARLSVHSRFAPGISEFLEISKMKTMKIRLILCSVLAAGLLAGCATENESQLQAKAKISKADAQATALAKVANGTVKECELEREHGKLIWSVAITTADSKDITEVNVDALTGDVVNAEHEKAEKYEGASELISSTRAGASGLPNSRRRPALTRVGSTRPARQ